MAKLCKICGQPEREHHDFLPIEIPEGCVCDSGTWDISDTIPPVCSEYTGDGINNCEICEHDKECHKPPEKTLGEILFKEGEND